MKRFGVTIFSVSIGISILFISIGISQSHVPTLIFSQFNVYDSLYSAHLKRTIETSLNQATGKIGSRVVASLMDSLLSDYYFLNLAYEAGYHKKAYIRDDIERTARTIAIQSNGLLYDMVVNQNTTVTPGDIERTYQKRNKSYMMEYMKFVRGDDLASYFGPDTLQISEHSFTEFVADKTPSDKFQYVQPYEYLFPFGELGMFADAIESMNPGEVSRPLTTTKYTVLIHLIEVREREQEPYEKVYDYLNDICMIQQKRSLSIAYDTSVHEKAQTRINHEIADKLYAIFRASGERHPYLPEKYHALHDKTLITYFLDGSEVTVSSKDFFDFYSNKMLKRTISDRYEFYEQLWECAFEPCAYQDAINRGITATQSFQLNKQLYTHRVMLSEYERNILLPHLSLAQQDIEHFYRNHIDRFTDIDTLMVSIIECATDDAAASLYTSYLADPGYIDSLSEFKHTKPFEQQPVVHSQQQLSLSNAHIPSIAKHELRRIHPGEMTLPAEQDSIWYLFIKHAETGHRIRSLEEVREQIVAILTQQRLDELKAEMLPELKKKYDVIDTIDYDKYLSEEWIQSVLAAQQQNALTP